MIACVSVAQQDLFNEKKDTIELLGRLEYPDQFFVFEGLAKEAFDFVIYHDQEKQLEIEGMKYFNPSQDCAKNRGWVRLPEAIRFYQDVEKLDTIIGNVVFRTSSLGRKSLPEYFKPFYFKRYEVTNGEYKEFVAYVRDSLIRDLLDYYHEVNGKRFLDWEKKYEIGDEDTQEKIAELYLPENSRFYTRREFDTRLFNYVYLSDSSKKEIINVYPDTLCWVHDFTWSYNEPMTQNYFWHSAYDDFPVVGITYRQAKAFCHWKSQQLSRKYGRRIKVDLPNEIEWNYVCTNITTVLGGDIKMEKALVDNSWLTDLKLIQLHGYPQVDPQKHPNSNYWNAQYLAFRRMEILHKEISGNMSFHNPFDNTYDYTSPADLSQLSFKRYVKSESGSSANKKAWMSYVESMKKHGPEGIPPISLKEYKARVKARKKYEYDMIMQNLDPTGVSGLGGNVSEWMLETYEDNWKDIYELRQKMFFDLEGADATILALMERHYNYTCHKQGQLVRGANWFDERYAMFYGKNKAGMNTKNFADPNKGYATVGFRYVVRMN